MSSRAAVMVVLTVALLATGCSDEDPPASLPPSTSATTSEPASETTTAAPTTPTTTAATPGAPALPPAAQQQTPDGAAAFVQHWFDVANYSIGTTNSAPLRRLGDCPSCLAIAASIDQVAGRGNFLAGGVATVKSIQPSQIEPDGSTTLVALLSAAPTEEVDAAGNLISIVDPGATDVQYLFTLAWASFAWSVGSIQVVA